MVVYTFNHRPWKARVDRSLRVEDSLVYKVRPCLGKKTQTAIQMAINPNKQFKATAAFSKNMKTYK